MQGVIAGGSPATAEAGATIFRAGGNAVDAIVGAIFASFFGEPSISSPSGGGFALISDGHSRQLIDFFCATPGLGATSQPDELDFQDVPILFGDTIDSYHVGRGSTAVPGNISGLAYLLKHYGTMPLKEVLQPALELGRQGVELPQAQTDLMFSLTNVLKFTPEAEQLFSRDGAFLKAGEVYRNDQLLSTLEHLADAGWESVYRGDIAQQIVKDHQQYGGLITAQDLADYQVIERIPLEFRYCGHRLTTNPPPSAGGILIAYALKLLEAFPLDKQAHGDTAHITLLTEIMRQTNTARHRDTPRNLATPDEWNQWLSETIPLDLDTLKQALAHPPHESVDMPGGQASTTHVSAIDETGLTIGITTTMGSSAGYLAGNTGILMNNILGEGDLNPDGFHQGKEAGERILSMTAPTLVEMADGTRLVLGSAGSNRLRTAIVQILSNVLDWGMSPQEAVNQARVHFENEVLDLEYGFRPQTANELDAKGYNVNRWRDTNLYFGGAQVAMRDANGGFDGAGDPRRGGVVKVTSNP